MRAGLWTVERIPGAPPPPPAEQCPPALVDVGPFPNAEVFVRQQYVDLFRRGPTPTELLRTVASTLSGRPAAGVVRALMREEEFADVPTRCCGRTSSPPGGCPGSPRCDGRRPPSARVPVTKLVRDLSTRSRYLDRTDELAGATAVVREGGLRDLIPQLLASREYRRRVLT